MMTIPTDSPLDKKLAQLGHLMNPRTHVCSMCGKSSLELVYEQSRCAGDQSILDLIDYPAGFGL